MEVVCDLMKGQLYLVGDEVTCLITSNNSNKMLDDTGVVLAWANAQLYCFCSDSKVASFTTLLYNALLRQACCHNYQEEEVWDREAV